MAVDIRPLAGVTDVDDNVKQMLLAVPDFSVGDALHASMVNVIEGATPGHFSQLFGTGPAFRGVFFPKWAAGAYHAELVKRSTFKQWSDFAVATLCQAMYQLTHDTLHDQLNAPSITSAMASFNKGLNGDLASAYSGLFATTWPAFSVPYGKVDHAAAKAQYIKVLVSQVDMHEIWYASGEWKHPEWEMYHHYIKLLALGATTGEIDALIKKLEGLGLTIANSVDAGVWVHFAGFLQNHPSVSFADIQGVAKGPILASTYPPNYGGGISMPFAEGNSYEFTANSQPGSKYRPMRSGSCFAAGTHVLMADESRRPIEQAKPGDSVATPAGPREVAIVARPFRNDRALYRIQGETFGFTETHPFVVAAGVAKASPALACVEPQRLTVAVPTLSHRGIVRLGSGTELAGMNPGGPFDGAPVEIEELDGSSAVAEGSDEILYDLVLKPRAGENGEYCVGSERGRLYLVRSEIPEFADTPFATVALLEAMARSVPALAKVTTGKSPSEIRAALQGIGDIVASTCFPTAALEVGAAPAAESGPVPFDVHGYVSGQLAGFDTGDQGLDRVVSGLFETLLASLGAELVAACELAWRTIPDEPGDRLSVSVNAVHRHAGEAGVGRDGLRIEIRCLADGEPLGVATVEETRGVAGGHHVHCFNETVYFDPSVTSNALRLQFDVLDALGKSVGVTTVELPDPRLAYRRLRPHLTMPDGRRVGRIQADLRRVSDSDIEEEAQRRIGFGDAERLGYARALGGAMGRRIESMLSHFLATAPSR